MALPSPDFRAGVRRVAPVLVGIVPFGMVAGIAAVEAGLSPLQAMGLSVVVFAGAAQFAAIELLAADAPLLVVVVTAAVINLRHVMYSASIAPYFRRFGLRLKAGLAYLLTDQAYAFSVAAYGRDDEPDRLAYYLGVALTLWTVWQVSTVAGIVLGRGVPDAYGLSFALPLVFIALLVPAIDDRASLAAAATAGAVALVGDAVPLNLAVVVAALLGVSVGSLVDARGGEATVEGEP